jgi:hypothetical protein
MKFSLRNLRQRDIASSWSSSRSSAACSGTSTCTSPSQDRIAALEAEIQRLDVDIRRGEDARRNLPELRLAVALLEEERRVFLSQLPTEPRRSRT